MITSGSESSIPSEILISIEEDQLAEFTKASIQSQIERLRMFTEVKRLEKISMWVITKLKVEFNKLSFDYILPIRSCRLI